MSKLLAVGLAFAALAVGPAMAADMNIKAPIARPLPPPVPSWAGFYVGLNAGGGITQSTLLDPECFSCADLGFQTPFGTVGGQIGYNWQYQALVYGLEADWNWMGVNATKQRALDDGSDSGFGTIKQDQLVTIRGRMGLAYENVLSYVTAGVAFGHFNSSIQEFFSDGDFRNSAFDHTWHAGLAAGAGIEVMITPSLSIRGEYLFAIFPDVYSTFSPESEGSCTHSNVFGAQCRANFNYAEHIARVGLNWRWSQF
jgi:outer membrane immunogenic protein